MAIFEAHRQRNYSIRMDWGPTGAEVVGADCDIAVVIDVLSFTTTLTVAADRGTVVFPYRWNDGSAPAFAAERDAVLAVGRSRAEEGRITLSPGTVRSAVDLPRLVLPSPNGATISHLLSTASAQVIGVSLRNRGAAADWLLARWADDPTLRVAVIAAGERWPDGSLRPAVEDLWGAGALISALRAGGWVDASPEADAAAVAFDAVATDVSAALHACASGRELVDIGYADDVVTAAQLDESTAVPLLQDGAFRAG